MHARRLAGAVHRGGTVRAGARRGFRRSLRAAKRGLANKGRKAVAFDLHAVGNRKRLVAGRVRGAERGEKISPLGRRIGTHRRDMRWEAPDGSVWASRFEYEVYRGLKESGVAVRRTDEQDRLFYS